MPRWPLASTTAVTPPGYSCPADASNKGRRLFAGKPMRMVPESLAKPMLPMSNIAITRDKCAGVGTQRDVITASGVVG